MDSIFKYNQLSLNPIHIIYLAIFSLLFTLLSCGGSGDGPSTFTVSGTIIAPANAEVDSDVNDPFYAFQSNDSFNDAQDLEYPVILGGFVSRSGSGDPRDRFYTTGDRYDFYRVTLKSDDSITIYIADHAVADLDLFLYDNVQNQVDSSENNYSSSETVIATSDGDFFLMISAIAGASNYTLIVSPSTTGASTETLKLSDDFVPGDIVVKFKNNVHTHSLQNRAVSLGMTHKRGSPGQAQLFSVEDDSQVEAAFDALNVSDHTRERGRVFRNDKRTQRKLDTLNIIRALRKRSDVEYAEPNYIRKPFAVPDDTYYYLQWHYDLIYLPEAWDIVNSGATNEVIVAVIDTGILPNHPDLTNRLTSDGWDFIGDDNDPTDPGDNPGSGSSFHGTHVAGTIAAETDNAMGVAGAGWNTTKIMPIRVLGVNGGTSYDISQAVLYAAGEVNYSGTTPTQTADIINLSLGGGSFSTQEKVAFQLARDAGIIIVAAAGNSASNQPIYPAALNGVISVSAVDYNSSLAYYSSFGSSIDVAAPGGNTSVDLNTDGYPDGVLSTLGDDSSGTLEDDIYGFYQGTSMACPHVAGIAAIMKSINSGVTSDVLDAWLLNGVITIDLGAAGRDDYYGYGLIDAYQAVLAVQSGTTVPAVLRITPSWLGFGSTITSATLLAEEIGDPSGTIVISGVTPNASWLSITPDNVDANNLGTYTVTVDRSGVTLPGNYSSTITFTSGVTTVVEVPVSVEVKGVDESADAGHHYVLLVNADTGETYQDFVGVVNGTYDYSFSGVAAGDYYIVAGTDYDNDYWLGDPGEAFGAYLSLDQPIVFTVNRNRSGLNFYTELNINIPETLSSDVAADSPLLYQLQDKSIER